MTKTLKWRRDTVEGKWYLELFDNGHYIYYVASVPFGGPQHSRLCLPSTYSRLIHNVSYHSTQAAKKDLMATMTEVWCHDD